MSGAKAAIPQNRVDPTGTATLRERYAQRLRGAFADLNTRIREGVVDRDVFGLGMDILQEDDLPPFVRMSTNERKREAFIAWLERQFDDGVLEVVTRDENVFIRNAYARGLQDADRALRAEGITIPAQELEALFNQPVHRGALERLFTTNFEDLNGITAATSQQIGEELALGFAQGENPTTIARRITNRVDNVGKHRATLLARTRVIDAHSEATLNRFEDFGVTRVTVRAEWLTAGDDRVCPICGALEGEVWSTTEVRTGTFRFEAGEGDPPSLTGDYPIRPPSHIQCRCRLLPSVT